MAYVEPAKYEALSETAKTLWDDQVKKHGLMTNMKMTLAHDAPSLAALMTWYPLFDQVIAVVGRRAATLYAHAISSQTDCLVCSTFFRRLLKEGGEDPDKLVLNGLETLLADLGRAMAKDHRKVDPKIMAACQQRFNDQQLVALVAFGSLMLATNVFNNVMNVKLDDYLEPYRGLIKEKK